ncbi:DUF2079 domain-containing protein [Prochlorococcus sp. MIT 1307]|uniref:DUF2079 domain-containing protein n=1 Tax=Prochlorococcus sp. MIT 1307 TaxID=3096219 RepID=UPI002A74B806|nr:DUF2079 domain-containing protein [Prochlorococcus sp. MIT 1307]
MSIPWLFFFIGTFVYSGAVSLRHYWFQTSAWDLGIFDQAIYLISKGLTPESSLLGFHILGDHGALVLYPLGWLYSLFPSVFLLFVVQGSVLASSVFPLAKLAKLKRLSESSLIASLSALMLYPVVFNTAIFDFHPEVLAFPLILESLVLIQSRKSKHNFKIIIYMLLSLTCKINISFLVLGIGGWLLIKRRKKLGLILSFLSCIWFLLIGGLLIPSFGGDNANIARQAGKFGLDRNSIFNIEQIPSIIIQLLKQTLSMQNLIYICLLVLPVIYLLLHKHRIRLLASMTPFVPLLILNLCATAPTMKDLVHHYSLFIVPFIAVQVVSSLSESDEGIYAYPNWMSRKTSKIILGWSVLTFIIFSRLTFYVGPFQERLDTAHNRREALNLINKEASVLTTNDLVPHLSARRVIVSTGQDIKNFERFDQVLLDLKYPGWNSTTKQLKNISKQLNLSSNWSTKYNKGSVRLYDNLSASQ